MICNRITTQHYYYDGVQYCRQKYCKTLTFLGCGFYSFENMTWPHEFKKYIQRRLQDFGSGGGHFRRSAS